MLSIALCPPMSRQKKKYQFKTFKQVYINKKIKILHLQIAVLTFLQKPRTRKSRIIHVAVVAGITSKKVYEPKLVTSIVVL